MLTQSDLFVEAAVEGKVLITFIRFDNISFTDIPMYLQTVFFIEVGTFMFFEAKTYDIIFTLESMDKLTFQYSLTLGFLSITTIFYFRIYERVV